MRKRITWRTVVLAGATVAAGFVEHFNKHRDDTAVRSNAPRIQARGSAPASSTPIPLPTRHWQLGALSLESCELERRNSGATTAAWCADFDVAEDPAQPAGRHIELHLAVIRADAEEPDADLVVLLAGGPGEAATATFADTRPYADLLKRHNVLLLDQRGTGKSHPLNCEKAAQAARAGGVDAAAPDLGGLRKGVASCLAEVQQSADPRYYTTTVAVDDLDRVRAALGAAQVDLIGSSYGTRVAQQYLMRHPDAVRSVVLDSPAPNSMIIGAEFAANLESALRRDFDSCATTPACQKAFGDPMQALHNLRDRLRERPLEVSFRDPRSYEPVSRMVTPSSLAAVVRMFAYEVEPAALLPLSIDAAAHGDFGPLLGQERLVRYDMTGDMNSGMSMSVICSEDADQLRERPEDADTILGNSVIDSLEAQCQVWPHGAMPRDFHSAVESDKPMLILSGALDPVTPPRYGEEILQGLTRARHFVLDGQSHAVLFRGCIPKLVAQFLDDPEPERLDARCLDRFRPTPAFVDFNGATP